MAGLPIKLFFVEIVFVIQPVNLNELTALQYIITHGDTLVLKTAFRVFNNI